MAPTEIRVFAMFPCTVGLGPDLSLDTSNWRWLHWLTFPSKTLSSLQLAHRPYKWIRYAIGVVMGAEGHLSLSPSTPNITIDYNALLLPSESTDLYYHRDNEEKKRFSPLEPRFRGTRITSSAATPWRSAFREDVARRDGGTCVLSTDHPDEVCDAVHLVAHSKGDTYIAMYTQHRNRDPTGGDIVEEIDSVRNGLFLNKFTHAVLGTHIAFLPTPNFAMTTEDIDPTASPTEKRCTVHAFQLGAPGAWFGHDNTISSGSALRISDIDWPPAILFDIVYADAVLESFGTAELKQEMTSAAWSNIFYPDGITTTVSRDYKVMTEERAATKIREQNQAMERGTRHRARGGPDRLEIMAVPFILVPPDQLRAVFREANERAEAAEQKRVREKVGNWMKKITT
ncbi:hypothetical protein CC1G_11318 [Coprinopsis cinerea okayama7|uniref:HNH nuclease domain-containing protein n=1 Tax=Coprinopsis cinerea (strain Okayama-7 / 130 / ATCC MYA-4618 / FGSC 9003) TaxID=240176 RepID=A8P5P7_COPC7|nr:hypothetical protein CC1G_11318 [Coprinopsis cinerea okayama7\|eukprot:XP_001838995.2 hypothetical protein CC1G_11318 [Coprinopsis cinerea okayama7\